MKDAGVGSLVVMALRSGLLSAADLKGLEGALARGDESWIASVCQQCPGACGIRVRKLGPWPVAVAGNPLHPVNRGTLCPKGVAGLLSFYDPDRIRNPLKRVGERGAGKWQKISWDEAIAEVADRLTQLQARKESHRFGVMGGRYRGLMRRLFAKFLEAYGSPHYIDNSFASWQGPVEAAEKIHGTAVEPRYDLGNSRYLLSFAAPLLEAASSPVENLRGWGEMRRGHSEYRGRVVQVETRQSVTAAKADEWIPVRPGTEGWLALGVASIILREDLYDGYFLGDHTLGFSNFKSVVLENYTPQVAAEITGVPIDTIIRLAREFATTKPALAACGRIDRRDQVAIHSLNALVGSLNIPGGVLLPMESDLPTGSGELDSLQALFFYYTNPLFSNPQPAKIRELLLKIPFLVSFSPFLDETASVCDLILPDQTPFERWHDVPATTLNGFPLVGLSQPVHPPLHDTRHTGDVWLELAKRLGGPVAAALPGPNFEAMLTEEWKKIFESQQGDLFGGEFEATWSSFLARGGWWAPSYTNLEEFQSQLKEKGGWWDPTYHPASSRFEFPALRDLPTITPKGDENFPLFLNAYPLMALTGGRNANQAWLADIAGLHLQTGWITWAELNPETAGKLGVKENDEVWVESPAGKIRAIAKLYEGIHPEAVGVPLGFGHTAGGRWAKGIGENPRNIQEAENGGIPRERLTRVKVYKV